METIREIERIENEVSAWVASDGGLTAAALGRMEHYYYSSSEFETCPICGQQTRWDGDVGRNICPGSNGAEYDEAVGQPAL